MKSFTDIEQSKKLAKILPLESADMGWNVFVDDTKRPLPIDDWDPVKDGSDNVKFYPAWSLAALLNVIPKEVEIEGQRYAPCLFPITDGHWLYKLWYNSNNIFESPISVWCDNPVDACYEMIIKMYKQNLL